MLSLQALNAFALSMTDIIFFIVLGVLVVLCVAFYFLIPVINKKQYQEQRETLKKREAAFKSNITRTDGNDTAEGGDPEAAAGAAEASREDPVTVGPEEDEKK